MVISIGGSSMRRRTSRMIRPAMRPIARPPTPLRTNSIVASPSENEPVTTAATATL